MSKPKQLTYNDYYNTLYDIFDELEGEFVGTEEYEKAQLMLNAKLDLKHDKELNNILNGNSIVYSPFRAKTDNKGV